MRGREYLFTAGGLEGIRPVPKNLNRRMTVMKSVFTLYKRRLKQKTAHRVMGIFLSAVLTFQLLPAGGLAVYASEEKEGLCRHHAEHTPDCGYQTASGDGEGSPCNYDCLICPVEERIAGLPDAQEVTEGSAEEVQAQLAEILALYSQLPEDAQEQTDLSRCRELQEALEAAKTPALTEEIPEEAVAMVVRESGETVYVDEGGLDNAFTDSGNDEATIKLLKDIERETVLKIQISCTLNLDEYSIRETGSDTAVLIYGGTNVTIQGKGEVISEQFNALLVLGNVILEGGTFTSSQADCCGVYVVGGNLSVTGKSVTIQNVKGNALGINTKESVQLSAGTYCGGEASVAIAGNVHSLRDLLDNTGDTRYAFYQGQGGILVTEGLNGQSLPAGTYRVDVCRHDYKYNHVSGTTAHDQFCPACGLQENGAGCSYSADGKCVCGSTLAFTLPENLNFIYNGTAQEPAVTVTLDGTELAAGSYEVSYDNNIRAGTNTAKAAVTGKAPYSFQKELAFSIAKKELTPFITGDTEKVYDGTTTAPAGLSISLKDAQGASVSGDVKAAAAGCTYAGADAGEQLITASGITLSGSDAENYTLSAASATVTGEIQQAEGTLQAPAAVSRTFGDAAFSLGCTTNGDGKIIYASSDENTAAVSENGTVQINAAGDATVTVSLEAGRNYTGGAQKTVAVHVAKASAPDFGQELKQYIYTKGSGGEAAVPGLAEKLPSDRGETSYTASITSDDSGILSGAAVDENGKLTYQVNAGAAESTASIKVTAKMANYEDAEFTLDIRLVKVIQVKITAQAKDAVYDGSPHKGYADEISCDYPAAGYAFAYTGRDGTDYDSELPPADAGSYTVTIRVSDDSGDYEGSVSLDFRIEKASVTIRADDKTAEKGEPLPQLTYTVSGLAEKDSLAAEPELACSADMTAAGTWPITAGGAKVPQTGNYNEDIAYQNGTLTVLDSAVHVTGVRLDKSALTLSAGGTARLTAIISPENATDKSVSWISGSPDVASVDSSGNITAVSAGTAVITVTAKDGGSKASCTVTVRKDTGSGSGSGSTGGGSGSTGGSTGSNSGSGSFTGGSTSGSTGTGQKKPFMKDSSGREGWDAIRAEAGLAAAAPKGGTVAVNMNGAVLVPGSVFAAIRGKNVTVSLDMGNGIVWSVNGKDITAETADSIDFSVKTDAGGIPQKLIEDTADGLAHVELSLAHNGTFGFTAALAIRLVSGDKDSIAVGNIGNGSPQTYTGMYANLFYYDPVQRGLEFISAGRIGEDGTAELLFTHASDYTVIVSAQPMGGTDGTENPQGPQDEAKTETGNPQKPEENAHAKVKSVKLSKTVYTYSGKAKKPSVTATDTFGRRISGRYYTVTYRNNKKAGRAAAVVTFQGGYSGTVKKTFTIRPKGTSVKKTVPASGGFTVKWAKRTAQTSGYQLQYSRNSGFSGSSTHSVFVKKASVTKQTVSKLKAGKTYYVRIRTYKTVKTGKKSTKIYSAWSRTVRVKTKVPAAASAKRTA